MDATGSYCQSNPVTGIDADGLQKIIVVKGDDEGVPLSGPGYEATKPRKLPWQDDVTIVELDKPTKKDVIEQLIEADEFWFWGHGARDGICINETEKLTNEDLEYIRQERKRRGKKKMKRVTTRACYSCSDPAYINAWLEIAEELTGYEGLTPEPGDWTKGQPPNNQSSRHA